MCGRFVQSSRQIIYERMFGIPGNEMSSGMIAHYNVYPSMCPQVCIVTDWGARNIWQIKWGLVPSWSKIMTTGVANARSETIATKPTFRVPFRRHRLLVPIDGFYEWKDAKPRKVPHFIRMKNREPFALAGVWDKWEQPGKESVYSFALITTEPNDVVAKIHDRMPVIIPRSKYDTWLDPAIQDVAVLQPLLAPYPPEWMEAYQVGFEVNDPKNNTPDLINPVPG